MSIWYLETCVFKFVHLRLFPLINEFRSGHHSLSSTKIQQLFLSEVRILKLNPVKSVSVNFAGYCGRKLASAGVLSENKVDVFFTFRLEWHPLRALFAFHVHCRWQYCYCGACPRNAIVLKSCANRNTRNDSAVQALPIKSCRAWKAAEHFSLQRVPQPPHQVELKFLGLLLNLGRELLHRSLDSYLKTRKQRQAKHYIQLTTARKLHLTSDNS